MKHVNKKLWGGRFSKSIDSLVHQFNASIPFDVRLYEEDIIGSIAWARGLMAAGVLSDQEAETIIDGLEQVRSEFVADRFDLHSGDEDIHSAVERRLVELIGPLGGKLHTGRSRNDQVATDVRLWVMRACDVLGEQIAALKHALLVRAEDDIDVPMPGYTHLQHAQPITCGHWLLSHFWPLCRDSERFAQARKTASVMPLGSAALAGVAFALDRQALAAELGFDAVSENSIDAVSDRDFAVDFVYASTILGVHLSQLSEQLIVFSSTEFGLVSLDDSYATGSSLMPQKKNPDTLELTRGKAGRLIGNLTGLLATLKALPSSYDKDLQEDKESLFDSFDTLLLALPVMAGVIRTMKLCKDRMADHLDSGLLATDLADHLVSRGVVFRDAHEMVGQLIRLAEDKDVDLSDLEPHDFFSISDQFGGDFDHVFDIQAAIARRSSIGGIGPEALRRQLEAARTQLDLTSRRL